MATLSTNVQKRAQIQGWTRCLASFPSSQTACCPLQDIYDARHQTAVDAVNRWVQKYHEEIVPTPMSLSLCFKVSSRLVLVPLSSSLLAVHSNIHSLLYLHLLEEEQDGHSRTASRADHTG